MLELIQSALNFSAFEAEFLLESEIFQWYSVEVGVVGNVTSMMSIVY